MYQFPVLCAEQEELFLEHKSLKESYHKFILSCFVFNTILYSIIITITLIIFMMMIIIILTGLAVFTHASLFAVND